MSTPRRKKAVGISSLVRKASRAVKMAEGKSVIGGGRAKIFSILEYIEGEWGLNMRLYPAQRFLVKAYYNIPLDTELPEDPNKRIQVTDMFNTKVLYEFTEAEYMVFLYNEGRCNIKQLDHDRRELILAIGRRAGKTTLSGIFASYEVYRLLNLYSPQEYYGLPEGNRIQIISVATDKDQAGLLFNEVTAHLAKCEYFNPFIVNNTLGWVNLRTPFEIEKYGATMRQQDGKFVSFNGKASMRIMFKSCIAKGLRGSGNIIVILDEVAHFQDKGNSSAAQIYNAVTPSTAAFSRKDPLTGRPAVINEETGEKAPVEARIILISSPLGRSGKFFEKFDLAMKDGEGSENLLAVQAPTWEVNPTVPPSYYKEKYHSDPITFMTEHGAQFSDQSLGWIERESDLMECVDPDLRPQTRVIPKFPYQMGIDVGLVDDGTSIAITFVREDQIVLAYHETWYAGVDWKETNPHLRGEYTTPYAKTLANVERLDFDEIANWIVALTKRFYITAGIFDRWNGLPLEQTLHKRGLKQFNSEFFTRDNTSKIFQAAKMFMYDERLVLYDWPIPERAEKGMTKHSALIAELLSLQANQVSKNLVLVTAPPVRGAHDDASDALVRSIWLSTKAMLNSKHASRGRGTHRPHASTGMTPARYQAQRARKHGTDPKRNPRAARGRRLVNGR